MSNTNNDNDIDALLAELQLASRGSYATIPSRVAADYHAALTALVAERNELRKERQMYWDSCRALESQHYGLKQRIVELEKEMDALRKNTTELESELTAYAKRVSDLIAEKWRLQDRIKELEAHPPADRDLRERLVCAALTGILSNADFKLNEEDSALCVVAYADATLAAMRKGDSDGK